MATRTTSSTMPDSTPWSPRASSWEWAGVFDCRYGTGRSATERALTAGRDLLLDIDVQGAEQVRQGGPGAVSIFLLPPDYPTLEARLRD